MQSFLESINVLTQQSHFPQSGILLEMFYWWFFYQSICGWLNILFNRASGFWTLSEKSTTGQPCVMQPRETMSTCEERYRATFSGVTPPLASIRRAENSSFSAWAVTRSSCRWKRRSVTMEQKQQSPWVCVSIIFATWGWKLSSMMTSAPALAASLPSSAERHSTSILLLKPHTEWAAFTAWGANGVVRLCLSAF